MGAISDWKLAVLTQMRDADRVLDFAKKASDYIELETGLHPNPSWVDGFFNDAPPGRGAGDIVLLGVEAPDGALHGLIGVAPGYETEAEWYIGLLLLDPDWRGHGVGAEVLGQITALAESKGATSLKCAVLAANPRGAAFWAREGFTHHRDVPGDPEGDGHDRAVLVKTLGEAA